MRTGKGACPLAVPIMEVRLKIWLEDKGKPVFGQGRRRLLEAIHQHGSINRASRELGLPYRKAWSSLSAMEKRLGFKLLERRTGGESGGGTCLTREGLDFLRSYGELMQQLQSLAMQKANLLFNGRYAGVHSQSGEQVLRGGRDDSHICTDHQ